MTDAQPPLDLIDRREFDIAFVLGRQAYLFTPAYQSENPYDATARPWAHSGWHDGWLDAHTKTPKR
jgi:hypothetical protein